MTRNQDGRYSCIKEFCGHVGQRWVVRFCGAWVGQSFSKAVAQAMILRHQMERAKEAQSNG